MLHNFENYVTVKYNAIKTNKVIKARLIIFPLNNFELILPWNIGQNHIII